MPNKPELPEIKNSRVVKLYDYHQSQIPEEMLHWRVTDEEIQEKLQEMAARKIVLAPAERVEAGDGVRCACVEGTSLKGREAVLLYPGRKLPGAEKAEEAVLGKKPGEVFEAETGGEKLFLRVEEILRKQSAPPVTDELVKEQGIEGVGSIEAYASWYREKHEKSRKSQKSWQIYAFWSREMAAKSELDIDEAEQRAWTMAHGRWQYEAQLESGMNPCIPDEGTELLIEEQAIEKFAREMYIDVFRIYLVSWYLCEKNGFNTVTGGDLEECFQAILKQSQMTEDDYFAAVQMEQNGENRKKILESLRERVPDEKLSALLEAEAETYMEV